MKISIENPPYAVRQKCEAKFDLTAKKPVWTYGDTIYNPHDGVIDDFLLAHETVHMYQQGGSPSSWWDNYLSNPTFRFNQELEAYRVQFRVIRDMVKDRNEVVRRLFDMSETLATMYGIDKKQSEIYKLIKNGIHV